MVPPANGSGMVGHGHPNVREFLPGDDSGGTNIHIGDVGDVSTHKYDTGHILTPGDTPTDEVVAKTAGRWYFVLPPTENDDVRGGFVGGEKVLRLPPEHCHTVHRDQTHHKYVSGGGAAPWGSSVPEVAETVDNLPVRIMKFI